MAKAKVVALPVGRAVVETKERILDAAETLFMEHGYEATSLRALTTAADVNLAAVNYHFGTKEELFQAVLTRRLDPMNQRRLELLTRFEAESAPKPLPCDRILSALLVPALTLARDPQRGGSNFLRLLGRAYADPAPFIRQFLSDQYAEMIARFKAAFGRALPQHAAQGVVVAAAFHHGCAVVHARRHRRTEAHRGIESARDDERRNPAAPSRAFPAGRSDGAAARPQCGDARARRRAEIAPALMGTFFERSTQ